MNAARAIALVTVVLLVPGSAASQSADSLLQRGIASYQELDYPAATRLLRLAVIAATRSEATAAQVDALTYLGATQIFRGQPDSAAANFRRVLLADPRYRIDGLIFPPEVTLVFDAAREEVLTVGLDVPEETVVPPRDGEFVARVYPTSPHDITVDVRIAASSQTDTIFQGPAGDSLEIRWDLRIGGEPVSTDLYFLSVRSEPSADGVARVATVPLDIQLVSPDTLQHPQPLDDESFLPESQPGRHGLKALPLGLAAAGAVLIAPAAVAPGSNPTETRFLVAGAISLASIARVLNPPPGRPIPANIEINTERRRAWETQLNYVIEENASRLATARLVIRSGPPIISPNPRP